MGLQSLGGVCKPQTWQKKPRCAQSCGSADPRYHRKYLGGGSAPHFRLYTPRCGVLQIASGPADPKHAGFADLLAWVRSLLKLVCTPGPSLQPCASVQQTLRRGLSDPLSWVCNLMSRAVPTPCFYNMGSAVPLDAQPPKAWQPQCQVSAAGGCSLTKTGVDLGKRVCNLTMLLPSNI